jgi:hypothetical protein
LVDIPSHQLERLANLLPTVGTARPSLQQMVGFVGRDADGRAVTEVSTKRFGHLGHGLVCGQSAELAMHFGALQAQGIERFYVWFADFAQPATLAEFAETVIAAIP